MSALPFGISTILGADGATRYMTRVRLGRLRLHIFYRGDEDPDHHDHPWDFWTFPLTSYLEETTVFVGVYDKMPMRKLRLVRAFRLHYRPAEHTHRVLGRWAGREWFIVRKPIVTLVWIGRSRRKWGFLKVRDGRWCWIAWRDYVLDGGKHGPCAPDREEVQ